MSPDTTPRLSIRQKLGLALGVPLALLLLLEAALRVLGIDTTVARNKNFQIAVPTWLLADSNWVRNELPRLQSEKGVNAADVAWLAHFEEARYIQFKLKPGIDVRAVNPFNEIEVRKNASFRIVSNRQGFRTRDFAPKRPGTTRIVTLGDSSTFGWGLEPEDTWQTLLERRLSRDGAPAEAYNLGISGHTTRHGLGVLRHYALRLDPDLLVLSFGSNDARYVLRPAEEVLKGDETWLGAVRWTLLELRTVQLLRKALFSLFDPFKGVVDASGKPKRGLVHSVPIEGYQANLRAMIAEGRSRGAAAVLLAICAPDDYAEAMRRVAESEGVPFVDAKRILLDRLPDLIEGRLYPSEVRSMRDLYGEEALEANRWLFVTNDGCHPNRAGSPVLADALAEAVERALASRR